MAQYDFSAVHDRRHDHSFKYSEEKLEQDPKLIPLWVADMDFEVLPEIKEALTKRAQAGIFGYTAPWKDYFDSVKGWMQRRHNMNIDTEWISPVCGVVPAIRLCLQAFTQPKDAVMILPPVYYPFKQSIRDARRTLVECPLILKDGKYSIDFAKMEKLIKEHDVKMLIFCSPHNPIGRVWTKQELDKLAEVVKKTGILLVSDEIHMDFARGEHPFVSMLNASPDISAQLVICTAPSKTFNLAALQTSNIIIPNWRLKKQFDQACKVMGMSQPNIFGLDACIAGYTYGDIWVDELNQTLEENARYVKEFCKEHLPSICVMDFEGLYLLWMDFNGYGLSAGDLEKRMLSKAHLWMDEGYLFGDAGEGFERMNLAAPKSVIEQAIQQLYEGFKDLEENKEAE